MLSYQAADLFVLPTMELECFGLIILEALAMGCPIVATNVAAIPELLEPILPEFIVPANNVTAMRTKLQDYLEGRIVVPKQETLIDYVQRRYAKKVICQKMTDLPEVFGNAAIYYPPKIASFWQKQFTLHWPGATVNEMKCMDR